MFYTENLLFIYFIYSILYLLIPIYLLSTLFANHKFVFYVCETVYAL